MNGWAAVDVETTGLDPSAHEPWEVAIVLEDGTEHLWRWRPAAYTLARADDQALEVGGFADRAPTERNPEHEACAAREVHELLEGRVLIANNAAFDTAMLTSWLRMWTRRPSWHYRPVCIATLAAGWLTHHQLIGDHPAKTLTLPWSSETLSLACGVAPPDNDERHTALGDARWVARWWTALTVGEGW